MSSADVAWVCCLREQSSAATPCRGALGAAPAGKAVKRLLGDMRAALGSQAGPGRWCTAPSEALWTRGGGAAAADLSAQQ